MSIAVFSEQHQGPINGLHFNPHKESSHLLASGGSDCEVYVTSIERPEQPNVFFLRHLRIMRNTRRKLQKLLGILKLHIFWHLHLKMVLASYGTYGRSEHGLIKISQMPG
jgi:hypothetical protein